jgi:hypothetical protein
VSALEAAQRTATMTSADDQKQQEQANATGWDHWRDSCRVRGKRPRRVQLTITNHDTRQRQLVPLSSSSGSNETGVGGTSPDTPSREQPQPVAASGCRAGSDQQTRRQASERAPTITTSDCDSGQDGGGGQKSPYHLSHMANSQRLNAPRLSLLGKPIYLSSYKCHYRDTPSMRWKKRLRNFLEQPQGLLPWLYHSAL